MFLAVKSVVCRDRMFFFNTSDLTVSEPLSDVQHCGRYTYIGRSLLYGYDCGGTSLHDAFRSLSGVVVMDGILSNGVVFKELGTERWGFGRHSFDMAPYAGYMLQYVFVHKGMLVARMLDARRRLLTAVLDGDSVVSLYGGGGLVSGSVGIMRDVSLLGDY